MTEEQIAKAKRLFLDIDYRINTRDPMLGR
jgi:hypothetical protein